MNFSAWAIRNPIAPILAFFMLVVLGWQSFNALPITRFPSIDFPLIAVTAVQPGSAPAEMETQVTREIESAVSSLTGVKSIQSTINDGVSTSVIEFRVGTSTTQALQDVKDAVDGIVNNLPATVETPTVKKIDIEGQAIMTFAAFAPNKTIEELSWFIDDVVKRELQGKPGVGRVDRIGGAEREVRVDLDPVKLDSFGITASAVNAQLRLTNTDAGSGRSEIGSREQAIRTLGGAATADDLAATPIALPSGRFVKLGDLGSVVDSYKELRSFSELDGDQVVSFSIFKAKGASEVSVAEITNSTLATIEAEHPDIDIRLVDDTVFYTYGNYESAIDTLLEGALLAIIVVFLFLKNWRATLITAVALPLSAVPTFYLMDLLGFSLNLVSFLAITLATGILVDDAIVEIENIARHIRMGKTPYRAAIEAADEIGLAVIATTFTIVAVFVPVSFMPGIVGQYFIQFGMTVAIAVLFSLLVARLITPMMAAYLMRAKDAHHEEPKDGAIMRGYTRVVKATSGHWYGYYPTFAGALVVLGISLYFMAQVPGSFLPPEDVSRISVSIELPPGSTLEDTKKVTDDVRAKVQNMDGVKSIIVLGGSSPTGALDVRNAAVAVILDPLDHSLLYRVADILKRAPVIGGLIPTVEAHGRVRPQGDIEKEVFDAVRDIPDVRAFKLDDRGNREITYDMLSANEDDLNLAASKLEAALRQAPELINVSAAGSMPRPEVQILPRMDEAARLGITTAQIAEVIRVATIGDVDAGLAKLSIDGRQIPIRVQIADSVTSDLDRLGNLKIQTSTGATVPLKAVADVTIAEGPAGIKRYNRQRQINIGANLPPGVALGTAKEKFEEIIAATKAAGGIPATVRIQESGDAEVQSEMMTSFGNAMIMGLMLVLTVLILLFKSVIQPFTILFSLPLAIGGVAGALILTGNALSMPVLIGILMLMGIVTKNAILLVDFAIEMRHQGMSRGAAMIEAGRKRARPIVMTSIAMSAGMLPSALGVGEGGAFRAPMATAVIGGIIVSTVLSLVVVPAFFMIMDDLSRGLAWVFSSFIGKKEVEVDPPSNEELEGEINTLKGRINDLTNALDDQRGLGTLRAAE
ncbi:MAG: efflux RND transporter permease subunit [Deltaproteobacteria bacterium]